MRKYFLNGPNTKLEQFVNPKEIQSKRMRTRQVCTLEL